MVVMFVRSFSGRDVMLHRFAMMPKAWARGMCALPVRIVEYSTIRSVARLLHCNMHNSENPLLRVLVVDDTPDRASALREALSAMDGVVVAPGAGRARR